MSYSFITVDMLHTSKQRIIELYDCVRSFHSLEEFPDDLPEPQNHHLLPTLRPYQLKAVKWMLTKELFPSYYSSTKLEAACSSTSVAESVQLPRGGILADEMGLGKTVEVLACMLSNPRDVKNIVSVSNIKEQIGKSHNKSKVSIKEVVVVSKSEEDEEMHSLDSKNSLSTLLVKDLLQPTEDGVIEIADVDNNIDIAGSSRPNRKRKSSKMVTFDHSVNISQSKVRKTDNSKKSAVDSTIDSVILKYCHDGVPPKTRRPASLKCEKYIMLQTWYENCLTGMSPLRERSKRFQSQDSFQCCCMKEVSSDDVLECPRCKTWQHAECVGYEQDSADYPYLCFRCWVRESPVPSGGTVIISPEAISQQWVSEIKKHVKKDNLKILVYEGVRVNGYIQPHDLANYDVIIITYEVLTKELNYTEPVTRTLRHAKRFFAPTSPLLFVQWWRLCLDEAQMVEGSTCRAAEMAKKFTAVNKWAVTGTPIQKAVNDVVGLMEFLAGNEFPEFTSLVNRDSHSMLMIVPRVLWRTQMKDVLAETGVPPQTVDVHLLDFSKIEKYFYQCTHTECSQQFVNKITRFENLNITLKSLDRKLIGNLLNPLLKLRQACLHPQAVRGKFMSMKKTMTMEDLVAQMVINARLDAEQALRQLVAAFNGMGALYIILKQFGDAVAAYRSVLHLEQEHRGKLKIDSLQRIHTMHNLAEVLDGGYEFVPFTLRDRTLREDIKALELRYLGKREAPIGQTEVRVDEHAGAIAARLEGATLGYSEWWLNLMEWSSDRDRLLDQLKAAIQHTDHQQRNQYNALANKLKSLYIVRLEVARWLAEVDRVRQEVLQWVRELRVDDKDAMAAEALVCHLPQAATIKGRVKCKLCRAENSLKSYEALLFEEKIRKKREKKNRSVGPDWTEDNDMDNREIADLVDVNVKTFETSKKGGFKASPIEKILRALAAYGKHNKAPPDWLHEANQHLSLMDRVKKEFLDLNLLWRQIFDVVDAKDELNMCKTRLRLPYATEMEDFERKKKKLVENQHIIAQYKVQPELHRICEERKQQEADLKKKVGTLCYLENLQKEGAPAAICPVCRNDLSERWSVLECGHCVCLDCLSMMTKQLAQSVQCPQCRQPCKLTEVSYVDQEAPTQDTLNRMKVSSGTYSTKVSAVVLKTAELIDQNPQVKILVFSAWEKVLDLLSEAFEESQISFKRLKSGKKKKREHLHDFKTGNVTVLLLPLRSGAKGLNLIEATHVFLAEPIMNPAEELQAVGRVHRIGQTKPTVVHRFIVRETIEERILAAVAESGAEQWSDDCVTLQQLLDLFTNTLELSVSQAPGPSLVTVESDNTTDDDPHDTSSEDEL